MDILLIIKNQKTGTAGQRIAAYQNITDNILSNKSEPKTFLFAHVSSVRKLCINEK